MQLHSLKYKDHLPKIHESAFLANGCYVIGDVTIDEYSSVWFTSVIRGDVAPITIGKRTNIQDGSIIHTSRFNGPTTIGSNVTIGHRAILHACDIEDNAFIGMGATILDKAKVEEFGFVAAGAVVSPGKVVGSKQLWAGVPAKYVRDLSDDEIKHIKDSAEHYVKLAKNYID
ncbi:MAG: hypothetical protein RLZZ59_230 [Pseudomonadota bacterium]|jgi:carbonic anhydrase/acetyltransferase-like protein (isoleucine patch superfamily)